MKVGETVEVTIAGQTVAHAKIIEVSAETATLIVPATQVVMAVRTELAHAEPEQSGRQVIIDGVDRPVAEEVTETQEVGAPAENSASAEVSADVEGVEPTAEVSAGAEVSEEV